MTYSASGSEFVVNKSTAGSQQMQDMIALPGGKFAVEFFDEGTSFPGQFRARVFDGSTGGAEITVGNIRAQAALSDGRLVGLTGDTYHINVQLFSSDLKAAGAPVPIFTSFTTGFTQLKSPTIAPLATGGFVATLGVPLSGTYNSRIFVQNFDAQGKAIGNPVLVGDSGYSGQSETTALSDGRIAVLTPETRTVRVFSADLSGTPQVSVVDTSALSSSDMFETKIVALKDSGYVIVWDEALYYGAGAIHAQIFDAQGKAVGDDMVVDPHSQVRFSSLDVAVLDSGDFVVAWAKVEPVSTPTGSVADISVRTFSPSGSEIGFEQTVNTTRTGDQYIARISPTANGGFAVGWTDGSQTGADTSGFAVRGQLFASNGTQTYTGTAGMDTLTGTAKDDTLAGLAGNDMLDGKGGNDTASYAAASAGVTVKLSATSAQDTVGAGRDTLVSIENVTGSAYADTLYGSDARNVIEGGAGADKLYGLGGDDRLVGGAGNDTLNGGTGADLMIGGRGNDTYVVDNAGDVVTESTASDPVSHKSLGGTDKVASSIDFRLPDFVEQLALTGTAAIDAIGNNAANIIVGNAGDNFVFGGGGADRLTGGGGSDTFQVSPGGLGIPIITDFKHGVDHLAISTPPYFAFYGREGQTLTNADLALGAKATTADQHLIYNAATSALFYDADGSGAQAQVKIAVLLGHPDLHASDIVII